MTFFGEGQHAHHQRSDVRMSLPDQPETVCPTGPMCGRPSTWRRFEAHNLRWRREETRSCASWLRPAPKSRERHNCVAASRSDANCATPPPAGRRRANGWHVCWRSTTGAATRSGGPAQQGCAQTGLNAKQSSCGARNARKQVGRWESPTRGGPEAQTLHLRTTPEHDCQQLVLLLSTECILEDNARLCSRLESCPNELGCAQTPTRPPRGVHE